MATSNVPATQSGGALTTKNDVKAWLQSDAFKQAVGVALPKHLTPERFCRIALNAFMRTPKLMDCTQESVFKCLLDLSALGLEPDGRRAHLIPYGKECTLIVDYKGLVELMMRGGAVSNIHADIVCENDEFEYDRGEVVKHKIDFRKDRGEMYAVYCRVTLRDGSTKCEALSKHEVDKIRKRSKASGNGPWATDYNEMAKKTACRRVSKWIPLSPEVHDAFNVEDEQERPPRETSVVDLAMFQASTDENRGHGRELAPAEQILREEAAEARKLRDERLKALPVLETFPDGGDFRTGDIINVKGEFWVRALPEATSEWERLK